MGIRDQRSRAREALLDVPGEVDLSEARDELRRELPALRPDTLREAEALEELEPLEVLEPSCLRIGVARKGAVERHGPRSIGAGEERAVDLRHAGRVHRLLPRAGAPHRRCSPPLWSPPDVLPTQDLRVTTTPML